MRSRKRHGAFRGSCREAGAREPHRSGAGHLKNHFVFASDDEIVLHRRKDYLPYLATTKLLVTEKMLGRALARIRSEEHTSELQSRRDLVCRLLLEKKKK